MHAEHLQTLVFHPEAVDTALLGSSCIFCLFPHQKPESIVELLVTKQHKNTQIYVSCYHNQSIKFSRKDYYPKCQYHNGLFKCKDSNNRLFQIRARGKDMSKFISAGS